MRPKKVEKFDPSSYYLSLGLIRIPKSPDEKKPAKFADFGSGFFGGHPNVLWTPAHVLTENGEPNGKLLDWVWVSLYDRAEGKWSKHARVQVKPELVDRDLDAAILRVSEVRDQFVPLSRVYRGGDKTRVLGFQRDELDNFYVLPVETNIASNWSVSESPEVKLNLVYAAGVPGFSCAKGMSGSITLDFSHALQRAVGLEKQLVPGDPDALKENYVACAPFSHMNRLIDLRSNRVRDEKGILGEVLKFREPKGVTWLALMVLLIILTGAGFYASRQSRYGLAKLPAQHIIIPAQTNPPVLVNQDTPRGELKLNDMYPVGALVNLKGTSTNLPFETEITIGTRPADSDEKLTSMGRFTIEGGGAWSTTMPLRNADDVSIRSVDVGAELPDNMIVWLKSNVAVPVPTVKMGKPVITPAKDNMTVAVPVIAENLVPGDHFWMKILSPKHGKVDAALLPPESYGGEPVPVGDRPSTIWTPSMEVPNAFPIKVMVGVCGAPPQNENAVLYFQNNTSQTSLNIPSVSSPDKARVRIKGI